MIWPLAACLYILIGGVCSLGIARANAPDTTSAAFDLPTGFALTVGIIALWPVLLALAITRNIDTRRKNDPR